MAIQHKKFPELRTMSNKKIKQKIREMLAEKDEGEMTYREMEKFHLYDLELCHRSWNLLGKLAKGSWYIAIPSIIAFGTLALWYEVGVGCATFFLLSGLGVFGLFEMILRQLPD